MNMVRVRFAPSPTGFLHIGGMRTALFNWLFARQAKGKFILRIEDTDKERSENKYLDDILESIKWLGLDWDELYCQSKRFDRYTQCAQELLKQGLAYKEGPAVILKMPQKKLLVDDLIRGRIEFDTALIKDQVLIKSDLSPTYNFACVVDDADLKISHIIRGDDHISNTPKQVIIYEALGKQLPLFAHLPLILDKAGGRLSKRTGAVAVTEYRAKGYLPDAVRNYLLLLGWSPGENKEIIRLKEAVTGFGIKAVNKTAATFDIDKLNWVNAEYIKSSAPGDLLAPVAAIFIERALIKQDYDKNFILSLIKLFQERINNLSDLADWAGFFFAGEVVIEPQAKEKFLSKDLSKEFSAYINRIEGLTGFDHQAIEEDFRGFVKEIGLKTRDLIHPVRVALTGKTVGPGLFETMAVLGRERVLKRLRAVLAMWGK